MVDLETSSYFTITACSELASFFESFIQATDNHFKKPGVKLKNEGSKPSFLQFCESPSLKQKYSYHTLARKV